MRVPTRWPAGTFTEVMGGKSPKRRRKTSPSGTDRSSGTRRCFSESITAARYTVTILCDDMLPSVAFPSSFMGFAVKVFDRPVPEP